MMPHNLPEEAARKAPRSLEFALKTLNSMGVGWPRADARVLLRRLAQPDPFRFGEAG
jgi:hypothetical protein